MNQGSLDNPPQKTSKSSTKRSSAWRIRWQDFYSSTVNDHSPQRKPECSSNSKIKWAGASNPQSLFLLPQGQLDKETWLSLTNWETKSRQSYCKWLTIQKMLSCHKAATSSLPSLSLSSSSMTFPWLGLKWTSGWSSPSIHCIRTCKICNLKMLPEFNAS